MLAKGKTKDPRAEMQGGTFRLQLRPEEESERGVGMLLVKHMTGRRLPVPRAGENLQNVEAWSARPPPLPFLAPQMQANQVWVPRKRGPTTLGAHLVPRVAQPQDRCSIAP